MVLAIIPARSHLERFDLAGLLGALPYEESVGNIAASFPLNIVLTSKNVVWLANSSETPTPCTSIGDPTHMRAIDRSALSDLIIPAGINRRNECSGLFVRHVSLKAIYIGILYILLSSV
jgi:hypothetical protein